MQNTKKTPQLRAAWQEKKQQQQLKQQYGIEQPDVVVVERKNVLTNTLRVLLRAAYLALRIAAGCTVAVLAVIGLAALIYPNIRTELSFTFFQILSELQSFFA